MSKTVSELAGSNGPKTILLIGGENAHTWLREQMLRENGHTTEASNDLQQARKLLARRKYDLVIVDVNDNPEMGLKFCEETKANHPRQKIALLTDHTLSLYYEPCPDGVIVKQEGPQHFLERVEDLLEEAADTA